MPHDTLPGDVVLEGDLAQDVRAFARVEMTMRDEREIYSRM